MLMEQNEVYVEYVIISFFICEFYTVTLLKGVLEKAFGIVQIGITTGFSM